MKVSEIRQSFLDFFEKRDHKILQSSSLVPYDDPTLLFTNAGMVQFKKYFLGELEPDYVNVATCQRCLRAGGKHNDLDNVGKTARHMTLFEMLGNFSFGGYFKEKAISLAWEFVTEYLKIPKEKIFATVYEEDDEAEKIWFKETDVSGVFRMGKKDNFWTMGDEGPAGPCSEIIVDRGEEFSKDHNCSGPTCGCDRYLEIWNLVFMQYNLKKDGSLEPLRRKNIDTGMGLERVASILQGVETVFDTDVFLPLRKVVENELKDLLKDKVALRVVLDASRAAAFAIADGIMPSNESRGYVIRRIIRRALRYSMNFTDQPFLYKVSAECVNSMSDFWHHLKDKKDIVEKTVRAEEERFFGTIARVLPLFIREIESIKQANQKEIPPDIVFMFYDTHGLPIEVMKEIAGEKDLFIDEQKLSKIIEERRKTSKAKKELEIEKKIFYIISENNLRSNFVGYTDLESEGKILYILDENFNTLKRAEKGKEVLLVVDETPFYPEGGGQVGDKGKITWRNGRGDVKDAKKIGDIILHKVKILEGELEEGTRVLLTVDAFLREQTARHHTTTHLLHSSLRKILGTHVRQMGSLVEPNRLRFDFSHPNQLSYDELKDIESLINEWIMSDFHVQHEYMEFSKALKKGALAFFGDKYGKIVRVVKIGEVSLELCGGTHLNRTGEAGILKIVRETGVASGIRRVEAVAGWELIKYISEKEKFIQELAELLKVSPQDILPKLKNLLDEKKKLEDELHSLKTKILALYSQPIIKDIAGKTLVFEFLEGFDRKEISELVDRLKNKFENSIILVVSEKDGRISIVGGVSGNIGIDAGDFVREISKFLGGSGGGRKDFAEGGGKIKKTKQEILEFAEKIISQKETK
jgi:alanyl-tRNA synthetase